MNQVFGKGNQSFQAAGGEAGIRQLVEDFYQIMDSLPQAKTIRNMHPDNLEVSIDKLARFLSGWLGGPRLYQEKYGSISIPAVHDHLTIGEDEKNAWLHCMQLAIARQSYSPEFAQYLITQLAVPAERVQQVCQMRSTRN